MQYLTEKVGSIRKTRNENESEMEKKERLAKLAEQKRLRLKREYQKSESVMEDNRSDANYDAKKYMVRLQYIP